MKIDMKSIQRNTEYRVKVRAIPINYLQGSWSEWSQTFSFKTPPGTNTSASTHITLLQATKITTKLISVLSFFIFAEEKVTKKTDERQKGYILIVCLVSLVVVVVSAVFLWKHKYDSAAFLIENLWRYTLHILICLLSFLHRIFTYMWPSIPHPKHTLVQICKPNKVSHCIYILLIHEHSPSLKLLTLT